MSPRARKWTKLGSYAAVGVTALGVTFLPLAATDPDKWIAWSERIGFPAAILIIGIILVVAATHAVWALVGPLITEGFHRFFSTLERQDAFIEAQGRHYEELKALAMAGDPQTREIAARIEKAINRLGEEHKETSRKIDAIHSRAGDGR